MKLAELHLNERGARALGDTLREEQRAAAHRKDALLAEEQALAACKKEHGRLHREQQRLEKEIRWVPPRLL